jgi:Lipocalin-like domain
MSAFGQGSCEMNRETVVGTWQLVSFYGRNADGDLRPALGGNAQGCLIYTAEGYMSAVLSAADRPRFASRDYTGATSAEALGAVNSYISYCGRYAISGNTITHHVEMSLYPNWIGQDQIRYLKLEGDKLILSTSSFLSSGREWTFELVWKRL